MSGIFGFKRERKMDSSFHLAVPLLYIKLTNVNVEITTHSRNCLYEIYDGAFNLYLKKATVEVRLQMGLVSY